MSGDISQFFGGIKSIQRGVISIAGAASSNTATITSVDTAKAVISCLGSTGTDASTNSSSGYVALTNATTVTATRGGSSGTGSVSWQVVEYY